MREAGGRQPTADVMSALVSGMVVVLMVSCETVSTAETCRRYCTMSFVSAVGKYGGKSIASESARRMSGRQARVGKIDDIIFVSGRHVADIVTILANHEVKDCVVGSRTNTCIKPPPPQ